MFTQLFQPGVRLKRILTLPLCFGPSAAAGHEAWLLTPEEVEALAAAPMPTAFASHVWLGLATLVGGLVTLTALRVERTFARLEDRLTVPLVRSALGLGPLILRLALAAMLVLAALGGLPRHGTAMWATPTLFVPDMQLSLVSPWWSWLAAAQIFLAGLLAVGLLIRWVGAALIGFAVLGVLVFGTAFLSYAPHFAAPGLMLVLAGAGIFSLDRMIGRDGWIELPAYQVQKLWRLCQILLGAGFIYLAVVHKLLQPTLLIAIIDHSTLPTFGLPLPVMALIMTGIEVVCGVLLVLGRLVRPVAMLLIVAFSVFAVALSETPFFHANLYGAMAFLVLSGRALPSPQPRSKRRLRRALA
ncbi:MAG: hypothetical protein AAFV38_03870 [Pseudomonadota bacterium]